MIDSIQPPTDNLYKFLAVGALAAMLIALVFLFREQAKQRERYIDAQIELVAAGYVEGSGMPAERDIARAYARREFALGEARGVVNLAGGALGSVICVSGLISVAAFGAWWRRVQRYDDAILRATAAKLQREEGGASTAAGTRRS